jgi:hypothetical protein
LFLKILARQCYPTRRNSNTVQSRPRLRWGMRPMRALRTAQHHLTSNLDEYRTTSDRDERGSQASTFFSFPLCTTLYKARFTSALSQYHGIFGCIFLIPYCIINAYLARGCRPSLKKGNRCCSCGRVMMYYPSYSDSYSDSYLDFSHSKLTMHGQTQPTPGLLRDYI